MLSIILNIITILIVLFSISLFLRLYRDQKNQVSEDVTASDVATDIMKDPLIVSRSYFTEPVYGPIGSFEGQQTPSEHLWIQGKSIQV